MFRPEPAEEPLIFHRTFPADPSPMNQGIHEICAAGFHAL
jgi:hypothetical protein